MGKVSVSIIRQNARNANVMQPEFLRKLRAGIEANDGRYPPLDVRELGTKPETYELLDGHQRFSVLKDMGHTEVEVTNWGKVSDVDTDRLLVSLNRLRGEDDEYKRSSIIASLMKNFASMSDLAKVIPEDMNGVHKMLLRYEGGIELPPTGKQTEPDPTKPVRLTFVLYSDAASIVEQAIARVVAEASLEGDKNARNRALELICADYLAG